MNHYTKLIVEESVLVIVDVQGKLAGLMAEKDTLFANLTKLIQGIQALAIPILWVEQNPSGLGKTITEISSLLKDLQPIPKMTFSCFQNKTFETEVKRTNRSQVLIAGIETHVCVYQTVIDGIAEGFDVHVVTDAVSSRTAVNKNLALEKMKEAGAKMTSVETALFELLVTAENKRFKKIIDIVK